MQYTKVALSLDAQVSLLRDRGLDFEDPDHVKRYLSSIGYYRFSAYWLPFEVPVVHGVRRNHQFVPGTTFNQVLAIYIFDRRLRLLVLEAIERVEIFLRAHWAQAMAEHDSPHAHMNSDNFKCPWAHAARISHVGTQLKKNREKFVEHYIGKYDKPYLPPIWAVVETLSMGGLSLWISETKSTAIKTKIARSLGLPTANLLEGVLHALTPVRNICAHHSRLWNRRLTLQLPYVKRLQHLLQIETVSGQQQPSRHLYNYVIVLVHIMDNINHGSSWKTRIRDHILTATPSQQIAMGFPHDWSEMQIFKEI